MELHIKLDDETVARLKRLTMRLPTAPRTTTAAVSRALHLLDRCLEVQEGGGTLMFKDADGVTTAVEIR